MARRFAATVTLLAAALAWAGAAQAGQRVEGTGELRWKSSARQILVIGGRDFALTGDTVLRDAAGRWITREQLDAPRSDATVVKLSEMVMGAYVAELERGKRLLRSVRVLEMPR